MKILHISPYFPSFKANHAGGVCMGKEIETLRQQGHEVYVLSFLSQPFDVKLYEEHKGDEHYQVVGIDKLTRAWHILAEPWMPYYFAARTSLRFALRLIWVVRRYHIDVIHAEYAAMGQYLWIKELFPYLKFTLVEHDMTAQSYERKAEACHGWKKWFMQWQLAKVLRKEGKYIKKADHVLTFNEKDRRLVEEKYGRKDVQILNPFFGELESLGDLTGKESLLTEKRKPGMISFLGQMARPENHQAAMRLIRIINEIKNYKIADIKKECELKLYIVGNKPSEELKNQENSFIHVTGFVEDVDSYLRQAQIAVFPLEQGAGIKVKVLRAMAVGTPVITGDIGAEGIDEDYEVLIHAETDDEYIKAIISCLYGKINLDELGNQSQTFVRTHFDWAESERVLHEIYKT